MRWAMDFAANLLGSSIKIFFPCKNGSFNNANGKTVLFPAPGGALTIKVFDEESCLLTVDKISTMGNSTCEGSKFKMV